jgi:hypothetical protein
MEEIIEFGDFSIAREELDEGVSDKDAGGEKRRGHMFSALDQRRRGEPHQSNIKHALVDCRVQTAYVETLLRLRFDYGCYGWLGRLCWIWCCICQ